MATVFKYPVPVQPEFTILMPRNAEILMLAVQRGEPQIWARVVPERVPQERKFRMCGTGHAIDMDSEHVGSFMLHGEMLVFHVFEIDPPAGRD